MGKKEQDKQELVYRTEVSPQEAAARLEEIAASLKQGRVCLEKGESSVVLQPGYKVFLEIGGSLKKDKAKLTVEVSWHAEEPAQPEEELLIGSSLPKKAKAEKKAEDRSGADKDE